LAAGLALLSLGMLGEPTWWLPGIAAMVLFSAVYDRCPIWRSVYAQLGELLRPGTHTSE
jgi:hypothetical protein